MRRASALAALALTLLAGCREESFDARFARERTALDRQGTAIETTVANDMRAAREAEQAVEEAPRDRP